MSAYDLATGERAEDREFALDATKPRAPRLLVPRDHRQGARPRGGSLAYDRASGELLAEYALDGANGDPQGTG